MMKKADRIEAFVKGLGTSAGLDPCYQGYFTCFNAQDYYEAHDVLEHLWLKDRGDDHLFYKGLIQIAGAFVHLKKQFLRPDHPKDARRLRPAVQLFRLGMSNLRPYGPQHQRLDVDSLCRLCESLIEEILASEFQRNPWDPSRAPRLDLAPKS